MLWNINFNEIVDLIFYCAISIPRAHADTIPNVVEPTIVKVDEMNGCDIKQFSSENQENYYFEVCSDSDDLTINQVAKTDDSAKWNRILTVDGETYIHRVNDSTNWGTLGSPYFRNCIKISLHTISSYHKSINNCIHGRCGQLVLRQELDRF